MNKLKLKLDELAVDTFDTTPVEKQNGTVYGEQCTCYTVCTCPGCPTCDVSCNGTCDDAYTCASTCNGEWTCQQVTECGASGYPNECPW